MNGFESVVEVLCDRIVFRIALPAKDVDGVVTMYS